MATFPRPSCRSAWEQRLQMQHSNDADNVCSKQSLALQQQQVPDNQFANRNSRTSISVDRQQVDSDCFVSLISASFHD